MKFTDREGNSFSANFLSSLTQSYIEVDSRTIAKEQLTMNGVETPEEVDLLLQIEEKMKSKGYIIFYDFDGHPGKGFTIPEITASVFYEDKMNLGKSDRELLYLTVLRIARNVAGINRYLLQEHETYSHDVDVYKFAGNMKVLMRTMDKEKIMDLVRKENNNGK